MRSPVDDSSSELSAENSLRERLSLRKSGSEDIQSLEVSVSVKRLTYKEIMNHTKSSRNPFRDVQNRKGILSASIAPNANGISIGTQTQEIKHEKLVKKEEDIFAQYLQYCCELCDFKVKQRPDFENHLDQNHNENLKPEDYWLDNMEMPEMNDDFETNWNNDMKIPEILEENNVEGE